MDPTGLAALPFADNSEPSDRKSSTLSRSSPWHVDERLPRNKLPGVFARKTDAKDDPFVMDSEVRTSLLANGDRTGHVFSCVVYNSRQESIVFWMCDDDFEKYRSHYLSVIRTDVWLRLPHQSVRLRDGERIQGY